MTSLAVESLFTNVPVLGTIDIIVVFVDYVYKNNAIPPLNVPKAILKNILDVCTIETSFRCPEGKRYIKKMVLQRSPHSMCVLFAEEFMSHVRSKVLMKEKHPTYTTASHNKRRSKFMHEKPKTFIVPKLYNLGICHDVGI